MQCYFLPGREGILRTQMLACQSSLKLRRPSHPSRDRMCTANLIGERLIVFARALQSACFISAESSTLTGGPVSEVRSVLGIPTCQSSSAKSRPSRQPPGPERRTFRFGIDLEVHCRHDHDAAVACDHLPRSLQNGSFHPWQACT